MAEEAELESPDVPHEGVKELAKRNYERINRHTPAPDHSDQGAGQVTPEEEIEMLISLMAAARAEERASRDNEWCIALWPEQPIMVSPTEGAALVMAQFKAAYENGYDASTRAAVEWLRTKVPIPGDQSILESLANAMRGEDR